MLFQANGLSASCIEKLAQKEIYAILVKGFIEPGLAAELAEKILDLGYEHYTNAPSIGRIGMAFYEAEGDPIKVAAYFEQAARNLTDLRDRCAPLMCPIDLLRCALDETWPAGAMLETLYGQKMYVGLSRVVEPGVTFFGASRHFCQRCTRQLPRTQPTSTNRVQCLSEHARGRWGFADMVQRNRTK